MKKRTALLLASVLALTLTACGQKTEAPGQPGETVGTEAPADEAAAPEAGETAGEGGFVIGFSNYNNEISWRTQMEAEFTYLADTLKADGTISDYYVYEANGDQAKQISDIQDLITMGADAIVVPAITSDGLNDALQEAMDEGIVVVNFDNNCSLDVSCKLQVSDYNHGWVSGQWL